MGRQQCPNCGLWVADEVARCPQCREDLHGAPHVRLRGLQGRGQMRRGVLYMIWAAVLYYFAAGYSPLELPVEVPPMVTSWILPLFFLAGLGLAAYGAFRYFSQ